MRRGGGATTRSVVTTTDIRDKRIRLTHEAWGRGNRTECGDPDRYAHKKDKVDA